MTFLVKKIVVLFITFEFFLFIMIYCFGPKGLTTLYDVQRQKKSLECSIVELESSIKKLQADIAQWSTDFAKEKIAREKLLMKRDDEQLYIIVP